MSVSYINHENIKDMRQRVQYSIHKKQYSEHFKRLAQLHRQDDQEVGNGLVDGRFQEPLKQMRIHEVGGKKPRDRVQSYEFSIDTGTKIEKIKRRKTRDPLLAIQSKHNLRNRFVLKPDKSNSDILFDQNKLGDNDSRTNANINTVERPEEIDSSQPRLSDSPVLFNRRASEGTCSNNKSAMIVGIETKPSPR